MITVPELVTSIVKQSPFLEEGLSSGIINLSSLARRIQPQIQKQLLKDIQPGAIIMALKRLESKLKGERLKITPILSNLGDITVRSNLINYTFENSSTLLGKQSALFSKIKTNQNSFLTITDGIYETSLFVSQNISNDLEKIFAGEKVKSKIENLSSITIIIPKQALRTSGVYYSILKSLAFEGINFIEVVSSYTELTVFLEEKDINKAFALLKELG
jgi:aspartokinase